ncbi:MAG: tetratricopeptide repeat protein, partial [Pirellulaceae bacterium]
MANVAELLSQGRSLLLERRPAEARTVLARLLELAPNHPDGVHLLAIACAEAGAIEASLPLMQRSVELAPHRKDFWSDYLVAHARLPQRRAAMVQVAEQALLRFPELVEAWLVVGQHCEEVGDLERMRRTLEQADRAVPENARILEQLGRCHRLRGELDAARLALEAALARDAKCVGAARELASVRYAQGEIEVACELWERVLKLDPQQSPVQARLLIARRQCCNWRDFDDLAQRVRYASEQRLQAGLTPLESPIVSVSTYMDSAYNLRVARAWAQLLEAGLWRHLEAAGTEICSGSGPAVTPGFRSAQENGEGERSRDGTWASAGRRITVGYLSDELRDHPTGLLMHDWFGLQNRQRFRVVVYFDHRPDEGDAIFRHIRGSSEECRYVQGIDGDSLAKQIRSDGVDILVGLKGWREPTRLDVFAARPAPVNVAFLGFPGTTGARSMDYVLADECVIPPPDAIHFSEMPAYLGRCYQVNPQTRTPAAVLRQAAGSRQDHGLPQDAVVLASFNQAYKLDPVTTAVWMRIMTDVKSSVLWLLHLNEACRSNLRRMARNYGVDPGRLIFAPWADHTQHLARLTHADLGLDTRIYNGHTTTSEALWCQVPVVTVKGQHFASRVSASILYEVGLDELVTPDLDAYGALVIALCHDKDRREELRNRLSTDHLRRTLFDTEATVRQVEDLFEQMGELHRGGRPPQMLRSRLGTSGGRG